MGIWLTPFQSKRKSLREIKFIFLIIVVPSPFFTTHSPFSQQLTKLKSRWLGCLFCVADSLCCWRKCGEFCCIFNFKCATLFQFTEISCCNQLEYSDNVVDFRILFQKKFEHTGQKSLASYLSTISITVILFKEILLEILETLPQIPEKLRAMCRLFPYNLSPSIGRKALLEKPDYLKPMHFHSLSLSL